ncbi:DUF397 domain-containing protein [Streptomyces sp. NPDC052496]|uniref:DUF397 domain-containing protein n=1 Tax=Streptomyces sp. NPDC052496 TaxID=3154951 RepID=UPI003434478B
MKTGKPVRWVKSTNSSGDGGQCVEWAPEHAVATGEYLVRDSAFPDGPCLRLNGEAFAGLVRFAQRAAV